MNKPPIRPNAPILDTETNLYSQEYYRLRLAQEKTRVERTNNPLSVLIVDIKCSKKKNNGEVRSRFINRIQQITRSTDIKAWYQDGKIAVLMPDTSRQGAFNLAEKLYQELSNLNNGRILYEDCSLQVSTYSKDNGSSRSLSFTQSNKQKKAKKNNKNKVEANTSEQLALGNASVLSDSYFYDILCDSEKISSVRLKKAVKRGMDIVGGLVGIGIFLPAMAIIALLIKATSSGPVFFKQERVGYRGKNFNFFKFRSMHVNTDEKIHKEHVLKLINSSDSKDKSWAKLENDPRITKLGAFLRKTSLDELPQFFNVLKGDMSLVGPRPPISYEVEKYQLWHLNRILEAKPGITGLWQVEGRGASTFNDMVRFDLAYVNNWSLWLDVKILFKTVIVVLSRTGAA